MFRQLMSAFRRKHSNGAGPPFRMPPPSPSLPGEARKKGCEIEGEPEIYLTPDECSLIDEPLTPDASSACLISKVFYWIEGEDVSMTLEQLSRALELRATLGRPLERADLESIIEADEGVQDDA